MTANGSNDTVTLEIIRASEVTPREVKWLWYPYIPFGKITLLQGDPGDGKSKFMLALSALLTDGKPLPFQEAEEASGPMTVIYQTTEDDADDTVVPRFIASGGNRDNLIFISSMFSLIAVTSHFLNLNALHGLTRRQHENHTEFSEEKGE